MAPWWPILPQGTALLPPSAAPELNGCSWPTGARPSADMRFLGIDDYLAELNVLVDHLGGLVDLVGLCQGGWLSLVYAARFPAKVRKLAMAGAPVDIAARQSELSAIAAATPLAMFQSLVDSGDGRVIGRNVAPLWGNETVEPEIFAKRCRRLSRSTRRNSRTSKPASGSGMPGPSMFPAPTISKSSRNCTSTTNWPPEASSRWDKKSTSRACGFQCIFWPASADEVVAPEQLLAVERLVGTRRSISAMRSRPSNHLGLFMGKRTLEEYWPRIVHWMKEPLPEGTSRH